jgi:hypothetical protein
MIYGVQVDMKDGSRAFLAVVANTQFEAGEYAREHYATHSVESISVQNFESVLYSQFHGAAVLS